MMKDVVGPLAEILLNRGWTLVTAESCTGGLIAVTCTDLPGSSRWFERGWVTYSNAAKSDLLGVPPKLIAQYGAVSEPVVCAMVQGALVRSGAQVAVAATGIAGPDGGHADKPVGTVWLSWASPAGLHSARHLFRGDRAAIRRSAARESLTHLLTLLTKDTAC